MRLMQQNLLSIYYNRSILVHIRFHRVLSQKESSARLGSSFGKYLYQMELVEFRIKKKKVKPQLCFMKVKNVRSSFSHDRVTGIFVLLLGQKFLCSIARNHFNVFEPRKFTYFDCLFCHYRYRSH